MELLIEQCMAQMSNSPSLRLWMACITGGKRCERILTGGQTALNWGCFYILALAVVGCFREFSVMKVLVLQIGL